MLKKGVTIALLSVLSLGAAAQDKQLFNHMDLGVTAGATGIGMEMSMPMSQWARVRAGFTYMPHFKLNSRFGVETGDGSNLSQGTINKLVDMMSSLTHMNIDDHVDMKLEPTWTQFKLLVDVLPFKNNKHWSLTVGLFAGPNRVGKAYNRPEEAATLLGVNMYNYFYTKSCLGESMFGDVELGSMTMPNVQLDPKYLARGIMGMPIGYFDNPDPAGNPKRYKAMLVPDENGMVQAEMKVNSIRPYLGVGYNTTFGKKQDFRLCVDAGVMFWGGNPDVYVDNVYKIDTESIDPDMWNYDIVHFDMSDPDMDNWGFVTDEPLQQVNLTHELHDIRGKVGDMVKVANKFTCFPVLSLTISKTIF